jgi:hypothetical protein
MWRHLHHLDDRLYGETDLALMYLRAFFYDDVVFAASLLDRGNDIVEAFHRRLFDLEDVTVADVRAFESHLKDNPDPHGFLPGLRRSRAEAEDARRRLDEAFDYRNGPFSDVVPGGGTVSWSLAQLAAQRPYVTVCSVPVLARRTSEGLDVLWRGERVWTMAPGDIVETPGDETPDDDRPEFEATLDVLLGTAGQQSLARFAVLSRPDRTRAIACAPVGAMVDQHTSLRDAVILGTAGRENRREQGERLRFIADMIVEQDAALRIDAEQVRARLDATVDKVYEETALWWCPFEYRDDCARLMADKGFSALLGSPGAVKRMAFLGLAASLDSYQDSIAERFVEYGYDLGQTIDELTTCQQRHGFPPRLEHSEEDSDRPLLVPFI